MKIFARIVGAALLLASTAQLATAQEKSGLYLSGFFGVAAADNWERIVRNVEGTPFLIGTPSTGNESKDLGFGASLGYRMDRNLAVEIGYTDAGAANVQFATIPARFDSEHRHVSASLLGIAPVGQYLEIYARLGVAHWQIDSTFTIFGIPFENHFSGNDLLIGAGLTYALSKRLDMLGDYQRLKMKVPGGYLSLDHYFYGLRLNFY